jgi:hypothetical protein
VPLPVTQKQMKMEKKGWFSNFRITIADFGSAGFGNASKPEVSAVVDDQVEISQNFLQP